MVENRKQFVQMMKMAEITNQVITLLFKSVLKILSVKTYEY